MITHSLLDIATATRIESMREHDVGELDLDDGGPEGRQAEPRLGRLGLCAAALRVGRREKCVYGRYSR